MSDDSNNPKEDQLSSDERVSILDGIPEPDEGDALLDQLFGVTTASDDDDDVVTHSERPSAASLLAATESVSSDESAERQSVVFLEEDNSVRTAMVRALTNLAGVDAFGVDTFDALVAAAKVRPPRLFIANIDMNEGSGIELLGKLDELDLEVPIVFGTNTPGAAVGPQLAEYGIYVLDRPIQFHELKERVDSALGSPLSLQRRYGFGPHLMLASFSRRTLAFDINWGDSSSGRVLVVEGEVWDARHLDYDALRALGAIVAAEDAVVRCRVLAHVPAEEARRLQGPLDEMLTAALERHSQLADEDGHEDSSAHAAVEEEAGESEASSDVAPEQTPAGEIMDVDAGAVEIVSAEGDGSDDESTGVDERLSMIEEEGADQREHELGDVIPAPEPASESWDDSVEPEAVEVLENLADASGPSDVTWTMAERQADEQAADSEAPEPAAEDAAQEQQIIAVEAGEVVVGEKEPTESERPLSASLLGPTDNAPESISIDGLLPPSLEGEAFGNDASAMQAEASEQVDAEQAATVEQTATVEGDDAKALDTASELATHAEEADGNQAEPSESAEGDTDSAAEAPTTAEEGAPEQAVAEAGSGLENALAADASEPETSAASEDESGGTVVPPAVTLEASAEEQAAAAASPAVLDDAPADTEQDSNEVAVAEAAATDPDVGLDGSDSAEGFEATEQTQPIDLAVVEAVDLTVEAGDDQASDTDGISMALADLDDADVVVALGDAEFGSEPLVDATVRLMQSGERDAWVERAKFLQEEAPSREEPAQRAAALLVVSELFAMAGEEKLAEETAKEALELAPSSAMAHRQVRGLLANRSAWPEVVEALEAETRVAPSPEAKTHSALLASELARFALDDSEASAVQLDRAERSANEDVRVHVARLVAGLAAEVGVPDVNFTGAASATMAAAVAEIGSLRGVKSTGEGASAPTGPHAALVGLRAVVKKGDSEATLAALDSLGAQPEFGPACQWLAASVSAADGRLRTKSLEYLEHLQQGQNAALAQRLRIRRLVELGRTDDAVEMIHGVDTDAVDSRDKVVLAALTGQAPASLGDWLTEVASESSLAGLAAAASAALSDSTDPDRNVHVVGSPNARLGSKLARRLCAWSQQSFSTVPGTEAEGVSQPEAHGLPAYLLDAAMALAEDEPRNGAARALILEHHARSGNVSELVAKLSPQADAERDRDQALFEGMLFAQASSGDELLTALQRLQNRVQDTSFLAGLFQGAGAAKEAVEAYRRVADRAEKSEVRARALLEAGAIAVANRMAEQGHGLLAEAADTAPALAPLAVAVGMSAAREANNNEELDRWYERAWRHTQDPADMIAAAMRMRVDDAERRRLLFEAQQKRGDDYSLREVYEWSAVGSNDRAPWLLRWIESGTPDDSGLALEAALRFELAADFENSARCLAAARRSQSARQEENSGESSEPDSSIELMSILGRRLAMAGQDVEGAVAAMTSAQRQSTEPQVRAEWLSRLASLSDASGDSETAYGYRNQALSEDPKDILLAWALGEGAMQATVTTSEAPQQEQGAGRLEQYAAAMAHNLTGADGLSFSMLQHRLAEQRGDSEAMTRAVERAAEQHADSRWVLRNMVALQGARGDHHAVADLEVALAAQASHPLQRSVHRLRAAEAMLAASDNERASSLLEKALEDHPGNVTAGRLRAEISSPDSTAAAVAWAAYANQLRAPAERLPALYRAATLYMAAEDEGTDALGSQLLEEIVAIDANYEDAFDRLNDLYVATAQYDQQAKLLAARLAVVADADERARLEVMRGRLLVDLGSADEARQALQAALDVRPDDLYALRAYVEVCEVDEDWSEVEKTLVRMGRLISDQDEQAVHYGRLANLYANQLPNMARAEQAYRQVLKLQPDNLDAKENLVGLFLRADNTQDALSMQLELVVVDDEPSVACARTVRLAEIHEKMGNLDEAEKVLREAERRFGKTSQVFRANYGLLVRAGRNDDAESLLQRVAESVRRGLAAGRFEATLFDLVSAVAELRGDDDAARVAEATLCAVEGVQKAMVGGGAMAASPDFDDDLAPSVFSPVLRQLLEKTGHVLDEVVPFDLKAQRAKQLGPAQAELRDRIVRMAAVYGLEDVQVWLSKGLGRVCVPVSSEPPVICLGLPLMQSTDQATRDFLLHRALKIVRAKCCALARSAPIDLGPLLAAYLQLHSPSYNPNDVDATRLATFKKRFDSIDKPDINPRINRMASEVISSIGNRASSLGVASCSWGTRTALLAGGDPFVAIEAVAWANGLDEGAPTEGQERVRWIGRQAEARDLIVFSVSQEYADLRSRVGIGVELIDELDGSDIETIQ